MFGHHIWSRFRIGRNLIFVIIATTILSMTAAGSNAAVFSFIDSVTEFFGFQPAQIGRLPAQPQELRISPAMEPIGPEIESMTLVFTDNFSTNTSTSWTAAAGTDYTEILGDLTIK